MLDLHEQAAEERGQEAAGEGAGAGAAFAALSCVGALLSAAHGMEAGLAEPRLVHHVCRGLLGTRDTVILALQMLIQLCLFSAPAYRLAVRVRLRPPPPHFHTLLRPSPPVTLLELAPRERSPTSCSSDAGVALLICVCASAAVVQACCYEIAL